MKLIPKGCGFEGQFRCGPIARPRVTINVGGTSEKHRALADERAIRMQAAISLLVKSGQGAEAVKALGLLAKAKSQRDFASVEAAVRTQAATAPTPAPTVGPVTFRDVNELWLSGVLHAQNRGVKRLNAKESISVGNSRGLMNVILPIIGDLPVKAITRADCDAVKRAASQRKRSNGKRIKMSRVIRYCRVVRQVLGFCVEPLRLIDVVPVSDGWVPTDEEDDDREFQMIYPSEDKTLMQCQQVKLYERLYLGMLWRCGLRPGEGARLRWRNIAFSVGKLTVEKTKTGKPRSFHPDDDVMRALEAFKPSDAQPDDLIFPVVLKHLSKVVDDILLPAIQAAGLHVERPELLTSTDHTRHLVAHDGRGTYVTLKGGLGATEAEIMSVTGHETSKEIKTYTRQMGKIAEQVARGKISWFEPLDVLLGLRPEPSTGAGGVARGVARVIDLHGKNHSKRSSARTSEGHLEQPDTANSREKSRSNSRNQGAVPPGNGGVAQAERVRRLDAVAAAAAAGDIDLANWLRSEMKAVEGSST